MSWLSRLRSTLFWSVIAAAFIGPGTVTTAAGAGAGFGLQLLWALLFSVLATVVLQELAARITLVSGHNLGRIIALRYRRRGRWIAYFVFGVIALGCAAYEAGNLLGALAGLQIIGEMARWWLIGLALLASILLWTGNYRLITASLAIIVATMGLAFCWIALGTSTSAADWLAGLRFQLTDRSALLAIGLIGTTIVPYNLFLGSGLRHNQSLGEMRFGLLVSIIGGGIITLAILLTGMQVTGEFSFAALAEAIAGRLGAWAPVGFGFGLFAAGFSSAITAPLAAAVTAQSLFGQEEEADGKWSGRSARFRLVWLAVLLFGLAFALSDIRPIPAIIAAQAFNGLILPIAAGFLLLAANDRQLIPSQHINPLWLNLLSLLIVGIAVLLGLHNLWLAAAKVWPALEAVTLGLRLLINGGAALGIMAWLGYQLSAGRVPVDL